MSLINTFSKSVRKVVEAETGNLLNPRRTAMWPLHYQHKFYIVWVEAFPVFRGRACNAWYTCCGKDQHPSQDQTLHGFHQRLQNRNNQTYTLVCLSKSWRGIKMSVIFLQKQLQTPPPNCVHTVMTWTWKCLTYTVTYVYIIMTFVNKAATSSHCMFSCVLWGANC